jgi:glycine cleavage system H protein
MSSTPSDRRYLASHEWHKLDGDVVTIGITQHAADELTDITYVALPKVGAKLTANARFGDLYAGVGGEVVAVNDALSADPGLVNRDPFTGGWMVKVKVAGPAEVNALLSVEDYLKQTGHA